MAGAGRGPAGGGRRDIPDALLFTISTSRDQAAAMAAPADRYRLAAVVVENDVQDGRRTAPAGDD
jgi:hypothetical protein